MRTRQKQPVATDTWTSWDVEQHHWTIGAKENQALNPGGPSTDKNTPVPTN